MCTVVTFSQGLVLFHAKLHLLHLLEAAQLQDAFLLLLETCSYGVEAQHGHHAEALIHAAANNLHSVGHYMSAQGQVFTLLCAGAGASSNGDPAAEEAAEHMAQHRYSV